MRSQGCAVVAKSYDEPTDRAVKPGTVKPKNWNIRYD